MTGRVAQTLLRGLPPVFQRNARILILGSMPGMQSLEEQRYYAHPRNAFWSVIEALFDVPRELPYAERLARLRSAGVALWDVIGRCRRIGSLDQKIEPDSVVANDFSGLLSACPEIDRIAFNGRMAEASFRRHVLPRLAPHHAGIDRIGLPSTSPAHAAMRLEQKIERWRIGLKLHLHSPAPGRN
ncbi:MAG: DNA-deoxyinosine glycosylase [Wenzhouxiangellaceae bacterium]